MSSSGFSALKAPLITAALVPDAPDVKMWFFCDQKKKIHINQVIR